MDYRPIAAVALSAACAGCNVPAQTTTLQAQLHDNYNMALLRPASTIYTPGTLASVHVVDPGTKSGGVIVSLRGYCQPGAALPLSDVARSATSDLSVSYNVSGDASAKAEVAKLVQLGAGINSVDRVDITLTNPIIYRPDDIQLNAALDAIRKICPKVEGKQQVTAVLQADLTVKTTVSASANLSANQANIISTIVGNSLGANLSSDDSSTMTGKGLFYAVDLAKVK